MELRQLKYLEAVLETGTFTAAAVRCRVAQPALWAQVRALAEEWELALFERAGRRVRPTAAAIALRPLVRVLLGDTGNIGTEVQRLRTGESGLVKLGAPPYQMTHFLAEAIGRHARKYPSAPLPLVVSVPTADPYTALAEGRVDLVAGTNPDEHGFQSLPLYRVWLAAAGKNVRAGRMEVAALRELPLAVLTREFASRVLLESALARVGVKPRILFEDVHADSLLALAREGLATAVVVNEALPAGLDLPVGRLCVKARALEFDLSLMWRDEATLSPAARRLRDTIGELATERRKRVDATGASGPRARPSGGSRRRRAGRGR